MAQVNELTKLAIDAYKGSVEKYSVSESQEVIRKALIEANNGSTTLNYKDIRDGKCSGLFSLVEEILSATIVTDLQADPFFNSLVDFRNIAAGDSNLFLVDGNDFYVVADIADGTQGARRQRLAGLSETNIPTSYKAVRIYEELNRVLSGRVDFNLMIEKVSESFRRKLLADVHTLWDGVTSEQLGGATFFPVAGAYDEDALLDLISHVEAAAGGKPATIVATKKALRKLNPSIEADEGKSDLYNMGYRGKFYGTNVVDSPQMHLPGTHEFALDDNAITVIAGDQKPIKVVYEGDPLMIMGDPLANADLTQEYLYAEKYGVGLVVSGASGVGRYEMV